MDVGTYLWLHGDTLIGTMNGGSRVVTGMPRNSVALLNVSAATGEPTSSYRHFIKSDPKQPQHFGFFSPPDVSQWYWPTCGVSVGDDFFVVTMRMENFGSGTVTGVATTGHETAPLQLRSCMWIVQLHASTAAQCHCGTVAVF